MRGGRVVAGLRALQEVCRYCWMCTHTSHRTWRCHGVKWAPLELACLREFRFESPCARSDSHYGSISPLQHSHVFTSSMEANGTNRQQCLAGAEGKLVNKVKVNNIPCCLQWAGHCSAAFAGSLRRKRRGSFQINDWKGGTFQFEHKGCLTCRTQFGTRKLENIKLAGSEKHGSHNTEAGNLQPDVMLPTNHHETEEEKLRCSAGSLSLLSNLMWFYPHTQSFPAHVHSWSLTTQERKSIQTNSIMAKSANSLLI